MKEPYVKQPSQNPESGLLQVFPNGDLYATTGMFQKPLY